MQFFCIPVGPSVGNTRESQMSFGHNIYGPFPTIAEAKSAILKFPSIKLCLIFQGEFLNLLELSAGEAVSAELGDKVVYRGC